MALNGEQPGQRTTGLSHKKEEPTEEEPLDLDPHTREVYCDAIRVLTESEMPFLVGGAYALQRYTGIARHTKDFDMFVRKQDVQSVLGLFSEAGYRGELTFSHWLGKVYKGDLFIDIIFSSGNGVCPVDDIWFEHAVEDEVFDMPVKLCPPEEILWTKCLVMERERYDGADVAHLIQACGNELNWQHILERFDMRWRVLLSHLILFGFIYPSARNQVPRWVIEELMARLAQETVTPAPTERLCQGTVVSREQYLVDVHQRGYTDGRLKPLGNMTQEEIDAWTAAIEKK